jgi:hypothetical protein
MGLGGGRNYTAKSPRGHTQRLCLQPYFFFRHHVFRFSHTPAANLLIEGCLSITPDGSWYRLNFSHYHSIYEREMIGLYGTHRVRFRVPSPGGLASFLLVEFWLAYSMGILDSDLNWAQRDAVATKLYKGDWRGAVAAVPDAQKPALQKLCDEQSLLELAIAIDPLTEGVRVDAADYDGTHYAP